MMKKPWVRSPVVDTLAKIIIDPRATSELIVRAAEMIAHWERINLFVLQTKEHGPAPAPGAFENLLRTCHEVAGELPDAWGNDDISRVSSVIDRGNARLDEVRRG
jgi:hypothetical protein